MTFDDGPRVPYTKQILDTLKAKRAPATFFVVGRVADSHPTLLKRIHREGHLIGNHSWSHPQLSRLSSAGISAELYRTNREIRSHGLPRPKVMRPPYGATNSTVRSVVAGMGMAHVMWTVDTSDWRPGRSASSIAHSALVQLHPRANILMHDGVRNSGATAAALPSIIDGARARGYCIGTLDHAGRVVGAIPSIRIGDASVREADPGTGRKLSFTITLSVPTSRRVSVSWSTHDRSASAGADYRARAGTVAFTPGAMVRHVSVPVIGDKLDEFRERLVVRLSQPVGGRLARGAGTGRVVDDDAPSRIKVLDASARESTSPATVRVHLNRPSGKRVTVPYRTVNHSARAGTHYVATKGSLVFRRGQTAHVVKVPLIDRKIEEDGTVKFLLSVGSPVNATIRRGTGVVSIADDPMPAIAAADVFVAEAPQAAADIHVTLSRPTHRKVTIGFATEDGTARAGSDYTAAHGTLTFGPGALAKSIAIPVHDDDAYTGDRSFVLTLSKVDGTPANATFRTDTATVTITEDDDKPVVDLPPVPSP